MLKFALRVGEVRYNMVNVTLEQILVRSRYSITLAKPSRSKQSGTLRLFVSQSSKSLCVLVNFNQSADFQSYLELVVGKV